MKFETTITIELPLVIKLKNGQLRAWVNDILQEDFDYEPFEEMLEEGCPFEDLCDDLIVALEEQFDFDAESEEDEDDD